MIKFDDILSTNYKHAEIVVVVEEDVITTAKVFVDKECVSCEDITTDKGEDVPFNRENYDKVVDMMKADVDALWEQAFAIATANR